MTLNKVSYKGKTYQEMMLDHQHTSEDACDNCIFHDEAGCAAPSLNYTLNCIPALRKDSLNVYYVEVQDAQ